LEIEPGVIFSKSVAILQAAYSTYYSSLVKPGKQSEKGDICMHKNRFGRFSIMAAALIIALYACGGGGGGAKSENTGPLINVRDSAAPLDDRQVPFGSVQQGATSDQTVTVTNTGTADLVIGTIANANPLAAPFSISANTCSGQTLAPSGTCALTVRFAPTGTGSFADSFDIPSNAPGASTVTLSVSGIGAAFPVPNIVVTDSVNPNNDLQVPFGSVQQGATSDQTVTITNTGTADLVIGTIANANPLAAPFSISANTCSGQTLAPSGTCALTVRFAPSANGSFSDSFDIPSDDPDTATVAITVSGISVSNISVIDSVSPNNDLQVPYGSVTQGNTSDQTVTVTNTGTADLVIGTIANANPLAAPFSITADTCSGQTLAPSGTCALTVRFAPTGTGLFTDSFDIPSNDPDTSTITVSVLGIGDSGSVLQMGGAIQGNQLSLTNTASTLAGLSLTGSVDGTGTSAKFHDPSAVATDGTNLYVADTYNHTIRKIVILTGAVTTLAGTAGTSGSADGTGTSAKFNTPFGITTDGTNLYVADTYNHAIRKIVISTGAVTTLAGKAGWSGSADGTGSAARFCVPYGITTDGTNLYVADTYNNTIRTIVISTGAVTTLAGTLGSGSADGTGSAARFWDPRGITTDGTNVYVTDRRNGTVRQIVISTGVVTTLAGTYYFPVGITTDGTNLYVADTFNHTIRKIVISTGAVTTFAGSGGYGSADGTGSAASFHSPSGITTDGTNLYVADTDNHTIRKIVIATSVVTTFAGAAGSSGSADGTGSVARFDSPYGIATDGTNLYVADTFNQTIRQIVISTGSVTTLAGSAGWFGWADGTGSAARFQSPSGITTDGTNLYVTDSSTIRKIIISTGAVTTLAGSALEYGFADGTGSAARFHSVFGITTDGTNLYVADRDNHTIRKIVISTGAVTTLAGTAGSSGSADGTGAVARFSSPSGITTDGTNLYVADRSNHTVRRIVISTGVVTTFAGTVGSSGTADGTGSAARFYYPSDITTDGMNLYVVDTGNQTIRKIVLLTGAVTTLAGTAGTSGSADSTGTAARFNFPSGITTDGISLYVTDTSNNSIRRIQ
jgi:sugar lactone lactonase YvrE